GGRTRPRWHRRPRRRRRSTARATALATGRREPPPRAARPASPTLPPPPPPWPPRPAPTRPSPGPACRPFFPPPPPRAATWLFPRKLPEQAPAAAPSYRSLRGGEAPPRCVVRATAAGNARAVPPDFGYPKGLEPLDLEEGAAVRPPGRGCNLPGPPCKMHD